MPLAVAGFDVGEAVPLFGQGMDGFGHEAQAFGLERQFIWFGRKSFPET